MGNVNSTNEVETSWMLWPGTSKTKQTKFGVAKKEDEGNNFKCKKHNRATGYPNSNFGNMNPVADNNGVCDGSWSSTKTNYYSLKYKDRFWE